MSDSKAPPRSPTDEELDAQLAEAIAWVQGEGDAYEERQRFLVDHVFAGGATFYRVRETAKTRTLHACADCGGIIAPGVRAWTATVDAEGRPVTVYLCCSCPWPKVEPMARRDPIRERNTRRRAARKAAAVTTERQVVRARAERETGLAVSSLVASWAESYTGRTRAEYGKALGYFAAWIGAGDGAEALRALLDGGRGSANARVMAWRNAMRDRGLRPATVNMRLAAVRALVRFAGRADLVPWTLDVPSLKGEHGSGPVPGRAGPTAAEYRRIVEAAAGSARDLALVRLMGDRGLRRAEVLALRMEDVDVTAGTVAVMGKGRTVREVADLGERTRAAVAAWVAERGQGPGALFPGLTEWRLYDDVVRIGRRAQVKGRLRPHGLRHAAITAALDVSGGDVAGAAAFARHGNLGTIQAYDDRRRNRAGEIARKVDGR